MISVFPNRATTLTCLMPAPAGEAGVGWGVQRTAGSDSMASRRAAPSSAEIFPAATWLKISRRGSFMHQIRNYTLPICQVLVQNGGGEPRDKLVTPCEKRSARVLDGPSSP